MSENETIFDEEIFYEYDDYTEHDANQHLMSQIRLFYFPFLIVIGIPCNFLALLILIRRRLWNQHEAYIYIAASLSINIAILAIFYSSQWLDHFDHKAMRLSATASIVCKLWALMIGVRGSDSWLIVLVLINVCLREHLNKPSHRSRFSNLAATYCTLSGTKIVIGLFFTLCALANFWFVLTAYVEHQGDFWYCTVPEGYQTQLTRLLLFSRWLGDHVPLVLVVPLICLIVVWKRKRYAGFSFIHLRGVSEENADVEVLDRIAVCFAAVVFVLKVPRSLLCVLLEFNFEPHFVENMDKAINATHLIADAYPLITSVVCFVVKSKFEDELKAMVKRCCHQRCPWARSHRTPPPKEDCNGNSVLQMDPVEDPLNAGKADFKT